MTAVLDRLTMNDKGVYEGIADPGDDLTYLFNFADFCNDEGTSIDSFELVVEDNCTTHDAVIVSADTSDDIPVTVAAGGVLVFIGAGTAGVKARVTCEITTVDTPPLIKQQTITLKMQER
jgi:hypothetical protein